MLRSVLIVLALLVATGSRAEWSFQGLDMRMPQDISADGSTVIGNDGLWWRDGKLIRVTGSSSARISISADGSVVAGTAGNDGVHPHRPSEAYRWSIEPRQEIRFEFLGVLEESVYIPGVSWDVGGGQAVGISADGSVIVGNTLFDGEHTGIFRWENGNMVSLGSFGGAIGISADGSVIVIQYRNASGENTALRWEGDNIIDLGNLGGVPHCGAMAISADGSVIVGNSTNVWEAYEAFSWKDGVMVGLDSFRTKLSSAWDVSADGSVIVGSYNDSDDQKHAFLWTSGEMFSIRELLVDHDVDVLGWDLLYARGISDDGTVIVGSGIDPLGEKRGWIATIPEPSAFILLTAAAVGLLAYVRWRRRS